MEKWLVANKQGRVIVCSGIFISDWCPRTDEFVMILWSVGVILSPPQFAGKVSYFPLLVIFEVQSTKYSYDVKLWLI